MEGYTIRNSRLQAHMATISPISWHCCKAKSNFRCGKTACYMRNTRQDDDKGLWSVSSGCYWKV